MSLGRGWWWNCRLKREEKSQKPQPLKPKAAAPGIVVQSGVRWGMANTEKAVRQSVSIPARIAKRVKALAKTEKTSASRVLVDLIETGLASKEAEKERFFALTTRLTESSDPAEQESLKSELARMTFGE